MRVDNGATRIENRPTQFNPAMRSVQTGSNGTAVDVTRSQTSNGSDAQGLGGSSRDVIDLGRNILDTAESLSSASGQDASEVMKKVVQWILSAIEGSGAGTTATGVSLDGAASSGSTIDPSGLAGKLPGTGEVSEEQLYAAILEQRIGETAGPEAAKAFAEEFQSEKQRLRRGDGYVPVEEAAQNALRTLSENGEIDGSAAEKINGEAFRAAQLDDNGSLLYDDRGGPGDPTKATASISDALERANRQLARFRSGIDRAEPRSLAAQSTKSPRVRKSMDRTASSGSQSPRATEIWWFSSPRSTRIRCRRFRSRTDRARYSPRVVQMDMATVGGNTSGSTVRVAGSPRASWSNSS